jgi:hypothetical protein
MDALFSNRKSTVSFDKNHVVRTMERQLFEYINQSFFRMAYQLHVAALLVSCEQ